MSAPKKMKGGDPFVLNAFKEAVKRNEEADTAFYAFRDCYLRTMTAFGKSIGTERLERFVEANTGGANKDCIKALAEAFFYAGFRRGILYARGNGVEKK